MSGKRAERSPRRPRHPWAMHLVSVAGIPIYIHLTFPLLLVWVALASHRHGGNVASEIAFVLGIFSCVVLHELGHALTAKRYRIRTRDIVLYPIGGVARLSSMGTAWQEFWITAAGPSVNVVLALLLYVALALTGSWVPLEQLVQQTPLAVGLAQKIWMANVFLAVFNLIPAFPMDGGRLLRSVLTAFVGKAGATQVAGAIGQGFAVLFGIGGVLLPNVLLVLIAVFIFLAAGREKSAAQVESLLSGRLIRDAMIDEFETLHHSDTLGFAANKLLHISQQDFPVIDGGGNVLGILTRSRLLRGLADGGRGAYVAGAMNRDVRFMDMDDNLEAALGEMDQDEPCPILVTDRGMLRGMVTSENLMKFLILQRMLPGRKPFR
jgi:Zn-dependent protease/CBS domain-containing protein